MTKKENEVLKEINSQYEKAFADIGLEEEFEKYEKSNQCLHEALEASSLDEARKAVNNALKYDPDNFDAKIFKVTILESDPVKQLNSFDRLLLEEEQHLKDSDCYCPGDFWLEVETRPYMRAMAHKMQLLADIDRCREAIAVGERMIELNENDNMGVRYQLMPLYALLEETEKAEALQKKFKKDRMLGMLLPLSVAYYRAGDYRKSTKLIKEMFEQNPHAKKLINTDNLFKSEAQDYYSPGEESEVYQVLEDCRTLLASTLSYMDFIERQ